MTLKVKVNVYHFQYLRESQDAYLVQIWWFQLKSIKSYHTDKPNFLNSMSKWHAFENTREYPRMNVWCKFDDSSPNLLLCYWVIVLTSWNVPEFLVKMAKMTLKVQVNDPYFKYQPGVTH